MAKRVPAAEPDGKGHQGLDQHSQRADQNDVERSAGAAGHQRCDHRDGGRGEPDHQDRGPDRCRPDHLGQARRDRFGHITELVARPRQRQQQGSGARHDDRRSGDSRGPPPGEFPGDDEFTQAEVQRAERDDGEQSYRAAPSEQRPGRRGESGVGEDNRDDPPAGQPHGHQMVDPAMRKARQEPQPGDHQRGR